MAHVRIAPASLPSDRPGRRLQTYAALPVDPAAVQGGMVGLMLGAAIAQLGPDALRWRPRGGTVTHAPPAPQPTVTPAVAPTTLPPLWELVWRPLVPPREAVHHEAAATHAGAAPSAPQLMLEVVGHAHLWLIDGSSDVSCVDVVLDRGVVVLAHTATCYQCLTAHLQACVTVHPPPKNHTPTSLHV